MDVETASDAGSLPDAGLTGRSTPHTHTGETQTPNLPTDSPLGDPAGRIAAVRETPEVRALIGAMKAIEDWPEAVSNVRQTLADMLESLNGLFDVNMDVDVLTEELRRMMSSLDSLSSQLRTGSRTQVTNFQACLTEYETLLSNRFTTDIELASQQRKLDEQKRLAKAAEAEAAKLRTQLAEEQTKLQGEESSVEALKQMLANRTSELKTANERHQVSEQQLRHALYDLDETKSKLDVAQTRLAKPPDEEDEIARLTRNYDTIRQQLHAVTAERDRLRSSQGRPGAADGGNPPAGTGSHGTRRSSDTYPSGLPTDRTG